MVAKILKKFLTGKNKAPISTGADPLENAKDRKNLNWFDIKQLTEIEKIELDIAAKQLAKKNRDDFNKGGKTWDELKNKDKFFTGDEVKKGIKNNQIKQKELIKHLKNKKLLKRLKKDLKKLKDAFKKADAHKKKGKKKNNKKEKEPTKKASKNKNLKLSDKTPSADAVARKTAQKASSQIQQKSSLKGAGIAHGLGTHFVLENKKGGGKITFAASAQKRNFSSGNSLNKTSNLNNKIRNLDKKRGSLLKKQNKLDKKKRKNDRRNANKKPLNNIQNLDESYGLIAFFSKDVGLAKILGGKKSEQRKNRLDNIKSNIEKNGAILKHGTPSSKRGKFTPKEKHLAKKINKINDATFLALNKKNDAMQSLSLSQERAAFSGKVAVVSQDKNTPNNVRVRGDGGKERFDPNLQISQSIPNPDYVKNVGFINEFNGPQLLSSKNVPQESSDIKTSFDTQFLKNINSGIEIS